MSFEENFYILNCHSYIKNIPTNFCLEFLKELKNDDGTLKPHVEKIIENVFYYGKECINATLPTCFIEIEYKTSDGHYLITHEVFLYEENFPTYDDLIAYKEKLAYGFGSQYSQELEDVVTAFHMGYGCECLSSGDY